MSIEDLSFQYEEMPADVERILNKIYEENGGECNEQENGSSL